MSVLVYTESWKGNFRKSTFETVSYANETAKLLGTDVVAISLGEVSNEELTKLGNYGVTKVFSCASVDKGDSQAAVAVIADLSADATVFVFSNTYTAKMIAPRLSAKLKAGAISNVISIAESTSPLKVKRIAFSSKAIETTIATTDKAILSLFPFFTTTTPQGIGDPINLCPLIAIESAPSAKSKFGFSPHTNTSWLSSSSAPLGTLSWGMLGIAINIAFRSSCTIFNCAFYYQVGHQMNLLQP